MRIVAQSRSWIVIDKPAGVATQADAGGGRGLADEVAAQLGRPVHVVHRLDRPVSGLVVFATGRRAAARLSRALRERRLGRAYLAVVHAGRGPRLGVIDEPIRKLGPGLMQAHPTGKPARTLLRCLRFDPAGELALIGASLDTGRTHQLRVHLGLAVGAICGDCKYGAPRAAARISLHAAVLTLPEPSAGPVALTCPPPADFWPPDSGALQGQEGWEEALRQLLSGRRSPGRGA